jgi:hypothetical protein
VSENRQTDTASRSFILAGNELDAALTLAKRARMQSDRCCPFDQHPVQLQL